MKPADPPTPPPPLATSTDGPPPAMSKRTRWVGPRTWSPPWTDGDADAAGVTAKDIEEMKK